LAEVLFLQLLSKRFSAFSSIPLAELVASSLNRVRKNENLVGGWLAQTEVFFCREPKDDSVPSLQWLEDLPMKVQAKCVEQIDRLGELGHELRRPEPTSRSTLLDRSRGMAQKQFHSRAAKFLYNRYVAGDPKREEAYEEEVINAEIARKIYQLRTQAGLTQRELAERVGTSKSAICRLEDADYEGHSLSMLKRIATALDKRVEIRFVPTKRLRTA
jgi:DNA-binding XRE family transcriptional regulator